MRIILAAILFTSALVSRAQDSTLQRTLDDLDFFKLRDQLSATSAQLRNEDRLYYQAFTDNAFNQNELAISRADSFKNIKTGKWTERHAMRMNEMLLDCYMKTFRYREAATAANVLMQTYNDEGRDALDNMSRITYALKDVPPQTAEIKDATSVTIQKNVINLWEIPVRFGGKEDQFIFDTGANLSTISSSYADKLGIRRLPVSIKVTGGQGIKVNSEMGVADSLEIGNIVFRNVVFLVMPDENLYFKQIDFRIHGIIGFPVINAMREVHITKAGRLNIPVTPTANSIQNLALNGFTPLVQARTDNDTVVFQFDTGAMSTHLFSKYFEKHKEEILEHGTIERKKLVSAGGGRRMRSYELSGMNIYIGSSKAFIRNVMVYTKDYIKNSTIAAGNMGHDVIDQFDELTINFEKMNLQLK